MAPRRYFFRFTFLRFLLPALILLLSEAAIAETLAVNVGKYKSGEETVEVECELIGTGRLRYPPKARKFRYVGQVIVGFSVAKDGSVSGARIADADPPGIFERSALSHIRTWKYKPPTVNGKVVQVDDIYVRLTFQPER